MSLEQFLCSPCEAIACELDVAKKKNKNGWVSLGYYGLDQSPIVAMIENYRAVFLWRLMRNYIIHLLPLTVSEYSSIDFDRAVLPSKKRRKTCGSSTIQVCDR
jgi:hypothetical protein